MKHQILSIYLLLFSLFLFIQPKSWAQDGMGGIVREGYGMVKTNISATHYTGWGNIKDGVQTKVSYEAVSNKFLTFTANARYSSVKLDFREKDLTHDYAPDAININGTHSMGQIGFTSTLRAKVFGKPFIGMAIANSEWSEGNFVRMSGMAIGLFMLKVSREMQFGIGPLVRINSNSKLPVLFMFLYRHRFNKQWLLNLYGGTFTCDYTPTKDDLLSLGADIDSKVFYFSPNDSTLPNRCRFSSTSIRPMVKYRRRLATNLYLDAETGMSFKISCKVNGTTGSKEYLNGNQKPTPFFQIGVSYSL